MFPVFTHRLALPDHWPASTKTIALGAGTGMWESWVTRHEGYAEVVTETSSGSRTKIYILGGLMLIMMFASIFAVPNPLISLGFIPIYLGLPILMRIRGSMANGAALREARDMLKA